MGYRVAVVGATGNVGREMMQVLAEREFPCDEVAAVATFVRQSWGNQAGAVSSLDVQRVR